MKFINGLPKKRQGFFDLAQGTMRVKILEEGGDSYLTFLVQEISNSSGVSNYYIRKPTLPGRMQWDPTEKVNFLDPKFVSDIFRLIREEVNGIEHLFLMNEESEKELYGYLKYDQYNVAYLMHFLTQKEIKNQKIKRNNREIYFPILLSVSTIIVLFLALNFESIFNISKSNDSGNPARKPKTSTVNVVQASDMSGDYKILVKK